MKEKIEELIKFYHTCHKNATEDGRRYKADRQTNNKNIEYGKSKAFAMIIDHLEALKLMAKNNNDKAHVMRSFTACPSCGSENIYKDGTWNCKDCTYEWGGK